MEDASISFRRHNKLVIGSGWKDKTVWEWGWGVERGMGSYVERTRERGLGEYMEIVREGGIS